MIYKCVRYLLTGYLFQKKKIEQKLKKFVMPDLIEDYKNYEKYRILVYTVVTGKYDEISDPAYISENFDYYIITDQEIDSNSIWNKIDICNDSNLAGLSTNEKSRYYKIKPHEIFNNYDISIYIDGNIVINGDLKPYICSMLKENKSIAMHDHSTRDCVYKEAKVIYALGKAKLIDILKQMFYYKKDGFPRKFGLYENNIIIRNHNDESCKVIMNTWWDEYKKRTKRDQLSFMYALWKNGYAKNFVMSLGSNSRANLLFTIKEHKGKSEKVYEKE